MSKILSLHEAKTRLSQLVDEAAAGEEIIIAKAGQPRARLVPLRYRRTVRRPGAGKGRIWIADDFDDPLPTELLAAFYGGEGP